MRGIDARIDNGNRALGRSCRAQPRIRRIDSVEVPLGGEAGIVGYLRTLANALRLYEDKMAGPGQRLPHTFDDVFRNAKGLHADLGDLTFYPSAVTAQNFRSRRRVGIGSCLDQEPPCNVRLCEHFEREKSSI